jgi:hypothetical protein
MLAVLVPNLPVVRHPDGVGVQAVWVRGGARLVAADRRDDETSDIYLTPQRGYLVDHSTIRRPDGGRGPGMHCSPDLCTLCQAPGLRRDDEIIGLQMVRRPAGAPTAQKARE